MFDSSQKRIAREIEGLLRIPPPLAQFAEQGFFRDYAQSGAGLDQKTAAAFFQSSLQFVRAPLEVAHVGYDQFRSCARGRRTQVGDKIRDREIDLVSDRGDDRQRGMKNCARDDLLVEFPEILDAAAATCEHEKVKRLPAL